MLEKIAMWGGIAGVAVAVFAVVILFLVKQNILNLLDKDALLFEQNFEIKQKAVNSAMAVIDELNNSQNKIKQDIDFQKRANLAYNNLLCVLSDVRIADEFYAIALEDSDFNPARLAQFKLMCRKDIGLKVNKSQAVKRALKNNTNLSTGKVAPVQPAQTIQPIQQVEPIQPAQPVQPTQPIQPAQTVQPAQPTPVARPVPQATRPAQARPVPPQGARPAAPTNTAPASRPATVRKTTSPKSGN